MYDTIIIGAGIAGLMAGRELQKNDHHFLCLDKKEVIGLPLKCGEGVERDIFQSFFGNETFSFIKNDVPKSKFIILSDDEVKERIIHIPFLQLDRPSFEQWLASDFLDKIKLKQGVESISKINHYDDISPFVWEVRTHDSLYYARSIILADGTHFKFQETLGLGNDRPTVAPCYLGIVNLPQLPKDEFLFLFDKSFKGYFWAFPKGDGTANVGIGSFFTDKRINLKDKFNEICNKYSFLKNCTIDDPLGGICPTNGVIFKTYDSGVLLVGDAGGMIHPFTGEGIQYALQSGYFAAQTIIESKYSHYAENDMQKYEEKWKSSFGDALTVGLLMRKGFSFICDKHPSQFDKLFTLPSEKDLISIKKSKIPLKLKLLMKVFM